MKPPCSSYHMHRALSPTITSVLFFPRSAPHHSIPLPPILYILLLLKIFHTLSFHLVVLCTTYYYYVLVVHSKYISSISYMLVRVLSAVSKSYCTINSLAWTYQNYGVAIWSYEWKGQQTNPCTFFLFSLIFVFYLVPAFGPETIRLRRRPFYQWQWYGECLCWCAKCC